MAVKRRPAILTIDVEEPGTASGSPAEAPPSELEGQLDLTLQVLRRCEANVTFMVQPGVTPRIPSSTWQTLTQEHRVGLRYPRFDELVGGGPKRFAGALASQRRQLEDACGAAVEAFRAPFGRVGDSPPWFGECLAQAGFCVDSSLRLELPSEDFVTAMPLEGSAGRVTEIPLFSTGFGPTRLTVVGGGSLRLLPLASIRLLVEQAEQHRFVPTFYLFPYDLDPTAAPAESTERGSWFNRAADKLKRYGRDVVADKLHALTYRYRFETLESQLAEPE